MPGGDLRELRDELRRNPHVGLHKANRQRLVETGDNNAFGTHVRAEGPSGGHD